MFGAYRIDESYQTLVLLDGNEEMHFCSFIFIYLLKKKGKISGVKELVEAFNNSLL